VRCGIVLPPGGQAPPREKVSTMSVAKVTEISATSTKRFGDAITTGIAHASESLHHVRSVWITETVGADHRRSSLGVSGEHDGHVRAGRLTHDG